MTHSLSTFLIILFLTSSAYAQNRIAVLSPDGKINVELLTDNEFKNKIAFAVAFNKKTIIENISFKLDFVDEPGISDGLELIYHSVTNEQFDWERVWGKSKKVTNQYSELTARFKELNGKKRNINLIIRVYNDGIAYKYYLPLQDSLLNISISNESFTYHFLSDPKIWSYSGSLNQYYQTSGLNHDSISKLYSNQSTETPVLIHTDNNCWIALLDAFVMNWPTYGIRKNGINFMETVLYPYSTYQEVKVTTKAPATSPWRVVQIAESPGKFLESDLIYNLCDDSRIMDPSWIKPGISLADLTLFNKNLSDNNTLNQRNIELKSNIDIVSEMGWEYQWVDLKNINNHNINQSINIPELVSYAHNQNVRLILLLDWQQVINEMDSLFSLYEKLGIAGIAIEMYAQMNQQTTVLFHKIAKKASKHKLLFCFNGNILSTGTNRLYPNSFNYDIVTGNLPSSYIQPTNPNDYLTFPYTRMLAGGMGYSTNQQIQKTDSEPVESTTQKTLPLKTNSRSFFLAKFIIFESSIKLIYDSPQNIKMQEGIDFLKEVPVTWDESRFVAGNVGEYIVMARKYGDKWYLAGINNNETREIEIKLHFLDFRELYECIVWKDNLEYNQSLGKLQIDTLELNKTSKFSIKMIENGGFAAKFQIIK